MINLIDELSGRFGQLKQKRMPREDNWKEIAQYVLPSRELLFYSDDTKDRVAGSLIYDSYPLYALQLLADGMFGYLVAPSIKWFATRLMDDELSRQSEVRGWLQAVDAGLYASFSRSNFYESMAQFLLDGASLGTACMYIEEDLDEDKISFSTRHPLEVYIEQNFDGEVDTVYRRFKLTARQAREKFGDEKLSVAIQQALEDAPYKEFDFIHACFPANDIDYKVDGGFKYVSFYFEENGEEILKEGGYNSFPYVVWRWRVDSQEVYGRSPAYDAIWDIKGLNQMAKTMIEAAQKAANPPLMIPSEMKGKVRNLPGGANYYEDPGRMIAPLVTGINYPIGMDQVQDKKEAVKQLFKVDFFLMLQNAERQMTATEIMERQSEKVAVLGATIGKFGTEALSRTIERAFEIETNAGRIPPAPELIQGIEMDIDYLGPLAQAQKRLSKAQGIMRSIEAVLPLMQVNPEIGMNIDWHETTRLIFEANGMPQEAMVKKQEVQRKLAMQAQMAQAEQQRQMLESTGKAIGLDKKPEEGSVVAQMMGADSGMVPQGA